MLSTLRRQSRRSVRIEPSYRRATSPRASIRSRLTAPAVRVGSERRGDSYGGDALPGAPDDETAHRAAGEARPAAEVARRAHRAEERGRREGKARGWQFRGQVLTERRGRPRLLINDGSLRRERPRHLPGGDGVVHPERLRRRPVQHRVRRVTPGSVPLHPSLPLPNRLLQPELVRPRSQLEPPAEALQTRRERRHPGAVVLDVRGLDRDGAGGYLVRHHREHRDAIFVQRIAFFVRDLRRCRCGRRRRRRPSSHRVARPSSH
mmetsp:Transcript_4261/g.19185  ORF Transcript_4261/g.19185 Transcript_4261/m.19185 type:complete len:263 (-) Transcript_4261:550-1338(-)